MDPDGKLITSEEGSTANVREATQETGNESGSFQHELVKKLALAQIIVGIISVFIGIAVVVLGTQIVCQLYCYEFHFALVGVGIWCGLMFICVGIIGLFAAKKKTTCLIVALMVVGIFAIIFAAVQISFGTISAGADRNHFKYQVREKDYDGRYRLNDRLRREIPVPLFVLDIILAVLGLVMVGLLIASSVVSCAATCCRPRPNRLNTNIMGGTGIGGMQMVPQTYINSGGQMYYVPQGYGGNTQATMQPMVMMPMNPQAPVQYQIVGQACPPYQGDTPTPQVNPATQQVPVQQV